MPETPESYTIFLYETFVHPLIKILSETYVLGYPLYEWIIVFSILAICIRVIRVLFNTDVYRG